MRRDRRTKKEKEEDENQGHYAEGKEEGYAMGWREDDEEQLSKVGERGERWEVKMFFKNGHSEVKWKEKKEKMNKDYKKK